MKLRRTNKNCAIFLGHSVYIQWRIQDLQTGARSSAAQKFFWGGAMPPLQAIFYILNLKLSNSSHSEPVTSLGLGADRPGWHLPGGDTQKKKNCGLGWHPPVRSDTWINSIKVTVVTWRWWQKKVVSFLKEKIGVKPSVAAPDDTHPSDATVLGTIFAVLLPIVQAKNCFWLPRPPWSATGHTYNVMYDVFIRV